MLPYEYKEDGILHHGKFLLFDMKRKQIERRLALTICMFMLAATPYALLIIKILGENCAFGPCN